MMKSVEMDLVARPVSESLHQMTYECRCYPTAKPLTSEAKSEDLDLGP